MSKELVALIAVSVLLVIMSLVALVLRVQLKRTSERERSFRRVLDDLVGKMCTHKPFRLGADHVDAQEWIARNNAILGYISNQTSIAWLVQMLIRNSDDVLDTRHTFLKSYGDNFDERTQFACDLRKHIVRTGIKLDDLEKVVNLPLDKIVAEIEALSEQKVQEIRTAFSSLEWENDEKP